MGYLDRPVKLYGKPNYIVVGELPILVFNRPLMVTVCDKFGIGWRSLSTCTWAKANTCPISATIGKFSTMREVLLWTGVAHGQASLIILFSCTLSEDKDRIKLCSVQTETKRIRVTSNPWELSISSSGLFQ